MNYKQEVIRGMQLDVTSEEVRRALDALALLEKHRPLWEQLPERSAEERRLLEKQNAWRRKGLSQFLETQQ